jgi:hypothetical protein
LEVNVRHQNQSPIQIHSTGAPSNEPKSSPRIGQKPVEPRNLPYRYAVTPRLDSDDVALHRTSAEYLISAFPKNVRLDEEREIPANLKMAIVLRYDPETNTVEDVAEFIRTHPELFPAGSLPQLLLGLIEHPPVPRIPQKRFRRIKWSLVHDNPIADDDDSTVEEALPIPMAKDIINEL